MPNRVQFSHLNSVCPRDVGSIRGRGTEGIASMQVESTSSALPSADSSQRRTGRPPVSVADRFWPRVSKSEGCWEWTGGLSTYGYGKISRSDRGRVEHLTAHRVSWELHFGPVPDGQLVCHRCDNRRCVRPDHLFLGTPADNSRDMAQKGRSLQGERHHKAKLTPAAVQAIRSADATPNAELAARYGVSDQTIRAVRAGKAWRHA